MNPVISSTPMPSPWSERVNSRTDVLVDFENGAASLGIASNSNDFEWMANSDGASVWVSREGVAPVLQLTDVSITEVALAFDQTMNPHIAYVADGVAKFRWWDTLANAYATMILTDCRTPRCCSDEKNPLLSGDRDLILTYMKGSDLCIRLQRDRFGVEYEQEPDEETAKLIDSNTKIVSVAMNTGRRLQWRFE